MKLIEITVPDIGDFAEVEVIEVLVQPGDDVAVEQSLVTVESDKASMEIPSAAAGKLKELKVKVGDKVSEGTVLGTLEVAEGAGESSPAPGPAPAGASAPRAAAPAQSAPSPAPEPAAAPQPAAASDPAQASPTAAPAGSAPPAGGGDHEVVVPDIGDFESVEVIEVLVAPGDRVVVEQSLVTVESDKASMEIPSSMAGTVRKLLVKVGDKVSQGTPIVTLATQSTVPSEAAGASELPPSPAPAAATAPRADATARSAVPTASPAEGAESRSRDSRPASTPSPAREHPVPADMHEGEVALKPHASPSVRRFARELGVDLTRVKGTGPKERITVDDVRGFVKHALGAGAATPSAAAASDGAGLGLLPWPKVDFARFGEVEVKPLPRIRKIGAANLHRNWVMIPHVTNHEDADITDLEAFRVELNQENAKSGTRLTMLAFMVKACVAALKKFPEFNASLDGESIVYKRYYHIGIATDTPNGLMVPVIRDADRKGLFEIAAETVELARKAREGKLSPAEMQGGTFSISSLGGIGGTYFTPIINAPEVAILGACRSVKRPVWDEKKEKFVPRLILPLSLSWDHRAVDGAAAARFNVYLARVLADFRRVLL